MINGFSETKTRFLAQWSSRHSYFFLTGITLLCLLPFSGRALHVDDPLFVWSGQQIVKHPLNPYGFQVIWDNYSEPMSEVTKNPPLACYVCPHFHAIRSGPHKQLLEEIENRQRNLDEIGGQNPSNRMPRQLDEVKVAIEEVIRECEKPRIVLHALPNAGDPHDR